MRGIVLVSCDPKALVTSTEITHSISEICKVPTALLLRNTLRAVAA